MVLQLLGDYSFELFTIVYCGIPSFTYASTIMYYGMISNKYLDLYVYSYPIIITHVRYYMTKAQYGWNSVRYDTCLQFFSIVYTQF